MIAKELAKEAKSMGLVFCDAPVDTTEDGNLVFKVGAESPDDFEKAKILLEGMGASTVYHCGEVGTGQIA